MRDALILATLLTGTTACPVAAQTINPNQIPNPIPPTPPQQECLCRTAGAGVQG
uniref:hypothetical protein n=1 Tax=Kamptonema formosum TaxID=331992 RepID=UPI0018E24829|nr:hypothetical protein [Oscillatoria sp. PCC 10802]